MTQMNMNSYLEQDHNLEAFERNPLFDFSMLLISGEAAEFSLFMIFSFISGNAVYFTASCTIFGIGSQSVIPSYIIVRAISRHY